MEFLKNKWTYVLLAAALLIAAAAIAWLLLVAGNGDPYAGGMLVQEGRRGGYLSGQAGYLRYEAGHCRTAAGAEALSRVKI